MVIRVKRYIWLLLVAGTPSAAQEVLTEKQAVERALEHPAVLSLESAMVRAGEGEIAQARTLSNPVLGLEREQLGGAENERQSTYTIAQRFEPGGKRALRADAAAARLAATRADVQSRRKTLVYEARRRFHETLALQMTLEALREWNGRLEAAESIAQKLQKGGEVAGYDRRRLARERATAASRSDVANAELARALDALLALTGRARSAEPRLGGELLPAPAAPLEAYLASLESRPDLRALAGRAEAFGYDEKLAQRMRIPDVTLSAGMKQVERGSLSDSGLVLGLSLPLPIFERGQGGSLRAAGQAQAALAERALALARAEGDVRGLWQQATKLRSAASDFRREALEGSRRLADIAQSAYRGGEAGILELLDAHRSLLEAETRSLELELAARMAQLELELSSAWEGR